VFTIWPTATEMWSGESDPEYTFSDILATRLGRNRVCSPDTQWKTSILGAIGDPLGGQSRASPIDASVYWPRGSFSTVSAQAM
jgi:hypothetical protein